MSYASATKKALNKSLGISSYGFHSEFVICKRADCHAAYCKANKQWCSNNKQGAEPGLECHLCVQGILMRGILAPCRAHVLAEHARAAQAEQAIEDIACLWP
jgi:hypothetical protein